MFLRHVNGRHLARRWLSPYGLDLEALSAAKPYTLSNLVNGNWVQSEHSITIPDPLNGEGFLQVPDTKEHEIEQFVQSLKSCPKSGLHNMFKNNERYNLYGAISAKAAAKLRDPEIEDYFVRLIQRVAPKSYAQAKGEVVISRIFFENFSGDQVRFLASGFSVAGDHEGQMSHGYRWPYGGCTLITPFNFPLEIPILQLMGALYMGNKVLLKTDSKVAVVIEQMIRLLHECGMPMTDVDFINCDGPVMNRILLDAQPRMTLFTGSSRVAESLAKQLHGRIKIEDAGFDWKILGPDVTDIDFVAYTSDQDAYAFSGQKCSAQSILFMHKNWSEAGFVKKIAKLASRRNLDELTIGPVLSVTNDRFQNHVDALLRIPGAKVLFGGNLLNNHSIPDIYGSFEPTAVYVPLQEILKEENYELCTTEIFGPFQIITEYDDSQVDDVLFALEKMEAHLTAAVVSDDTTFQRRILGSTVNGTTYCGIRARTTGAPQNHWFGPCGDPRSAGIGSPEAIKLVWSGHREIIRDEKHIDSDWTTPTAT